MLSKSEAYESEYVHEVYEQIASHFSETRYKPWPIVEAFLKNLPTGAIGLDIGCGNGKYLQVNRNVFIVGSDRSSNLTKIASQHQPHVAIVADTLALPHPPGTFDFAISIAVIHHLSTPERRIAAVKAILETLREGGSALLYVWALEQKSSRRGWDEGHEQDVMVPWVLKSGKKAVKAAVSKSGKETAEAGIVKPSNATVEAGKRAATPERTFQRYYHLYRKGELEFDVLAAGGKVLENGYERDNWWAIVSRSSKEDDI